LAPRQIVVMVPDLQPYEAAIRAVFDQVPPSDPRHIPYTIADLGPRGRDPLLLALDWLLRAPEPRCTASELRELLAVPALARRFRIAEEELPRLEAWWTGGGLRWGLDAAHRAGLGLPEAGEGNTWRFAVDRLLLGYASGDAAPFDGIEPYAEVGGLEAALAGGLALLFEQLQQWWHDAPQPRRPAEWAERLRALLAALFMPGDEHDRTVLATLETALQRWLDDCARADFDDTVPLAVARAGWLDALDEPSLSQRFTGGGVTFCTLMPMRAIPFEVVCLLGMNEGDYPRRRPRQDFDLMAQPGQRRPGDRAGRDDDRYLMLEALLSARRLLYVSWTGRSVRDNSEQPPSVLVGELRDYLDAGFGEHLAERLTTEHPLQPFSRRYFEPGAAERGWITYMREWREAHDAPAAPLPEAVPVFDPAPLLPLTAARLAAFLKQPVRQHFRERLGVQFDAPAHAPADEEAFELDGLQTSRLVDHLLGVAQSSVSSSVSTSVGAASAAIAPPLAQAARRLQGEGVLPLGPAGDWTRDQLLNTAAPMHAAWTAWLQACPEESPPLPLRCEHGSLRVDDWLGGARLGPDGPQHGALQARRLVEQDGETLHPQALIDTWVLALLAGAGGLALTGRLIGMDAQVQWTPPPTDEAREHLAALLDGWLAGLQQPLPVACRTALRWLAKDDLEAAALVYDGANHRPGEGDEPCLARTWPTFDTMADSGAFEAWAEQLYGALRRWVGGLVWSPLAGGDAQEDPCRSGFSRDSSLAASASRLKPLLQEPQPPQGPA
jgi:exodeoxyribonuclease V gamma subunit